MDAARPLPRGSTGKEMRLRRREFHALTGEGDSLAALLRSAAIRLVRDGVVDVVVVLQLADSREHAVWLEREAGEPAAPAPDALILPRSRTNYESAPLALDFVDALYRFPLQGYRAWMLETRQPAVSRALFGLSRTMQYDRRLAGMSVYRVASEPSHAVAFLALERDRLPGEVLGDADPSYFSRDRGFECHALAGVWTFGRLMPRYGRAPDHPRAAFWTQLGVSVMQPPTAEAAPSVGPTVGRGA